MTITHPLVQEHEVILRGLDCLKTVRKRIEKNEYPPARFFDHALPFFRNYADKRHHFKEEFLMFGLLAEKKRGELDLEIGALRHQHDLGRQCLTRVEASVRGYAMKNEIAVTTLLENLAAFSAILSRHIFREDHLFFPLVEALLSKDEKQALTEQFLQEEQRLNQRFPVEQNFRDLEEMVRLAIITTE